MFEKRILTVALIAMGVGAGVFGVGYSQAGKATPEKPQSLLSDSALEALRATMHNYEVGRAELDDVYRWSKRTMKAELAAGAANAAQEHFDRMMELKKRVDALAAIGAEGGDAANVAAVAYYVAEADAFIEEKRASK